MDLFGFSLGGLTALRVAMRHPERVGRLAVAATHYRVDDYHPGIRQPEAGTFSDRLPTQEEFQEWQNAYDRPRRPPGREEPASPWSGVRPG